MEPTAATGFEDRKRRFDESIGPHLGSVYNFARWLVRSREDAEDIVQEALLKAYRSLETFRGADARPWLLAIVRNHAASFLGQQKRIQDRAASGSHDTEPADPAPDPEASLHLSRREREVRAAISRLPAEFREALILRELEGLAYKEIAAVQRVPIGTVMSRLSRARTQLAGELIAPTAKEGSQ